MKFWLNSRIESIQESWVSNASNRDEILNLSPSDLIDNLIKILTHRNFTYQSKTTLEQLILQVRNILSGQTNLNKQIKFYFLYNGGYRASPLPNDFTLIFELDQTELMLVYQITLLNKKIKEIYEPGIEFSIVVNNGVAYWVNGISLTSTENYAKQLRKIIRLFGDESSIKVVIQSELNGFDPNFEPETFHSDIIFTEKEHQIVERFLGRHCNREEAIRRNEIYKIAEGRWWEELNSIIDPAEVILLRQVAHPKTVSFRSFPGGAMRIQNGTLGFRYFQNVLTPKLITSESVKQHELSWMHFDF